MTATSHFPKSQNARGTSIRIPKRRDPLQDEIDRRIAKKQAAERREPVPAPVVGPAALFDCSVWIRANTLGANILGIS